MIASSHEETSCSAEAALATVELARELSDRGEIYLALEVLLTSLHSPQATATGGCGSIAEWSALLELLHKAVVLRAAENAFQISSFLDRFGLQPYDEGENLAEGKDGDLHHLEAMASVVDDAQSSQICSLPSLPSEDSDSSSTLEEMEVSVRYSTPSRRHRFRRSRQEWKNRVKCAVESVFRRRERSAHSSSTNQWGHDLETGACGRRSSSCTDPLADNCDDRDDAPSCRPQYPTYGQSFSRARSHAFRALSECEGPGCSERSDASGAVIENLVEGKDGEFHDLAVPAVDDAFPCRRGRNCSLPPVPSEDPANISGSLQEEDESTLRAAGECQFSPRRHRFRPRKRQKWKDRAKYAVKSVLRRGDRSASCLASNQRDHDHSLDSGADERRSRGCGHSRADELGDLYDAPPFQCRRYPAQEDSCSSRSRSYAFCALSENEVPDRSDASTASLAMMESSLVEGKIGELHGAMALAVNAAQRTSRICSQPPLPSEDSDSCSTLQEEASTSGSSPEYSSPLQGRRREWKDRVKSTIISAFRHRGKSDGFSPTNQHDHAFARRPSMCTNPLADNGDARACGSSRGRRQPVHEQTLSRSRSQAFWALSGYDVLGCSGSSDASFAMMEDFDGSPVRSNPVTSENPRSIVRFFGSFRFHSTSEIGI